MPDFDALVEQAFGVTWEQLPSEAVYLGRHEYDGRVPDWSPEAVEAACRRLRGIRAELTGLHGLEDHQELDRRQLLAAIDEYLFDWEELGWWRRSPMTYVDPLDVDLYLKRDYAPQPQRLLSVLEVLREVPAFLARARSNLEEVIPRTYCLWGARVLRGAADFLDEDLPGEVDETSGSRLRSELAEAAAIASAAYRSAASWVEEELLPRSDDSYRIGAGAMEEMLRRAELVELSLEELAALGRRDLEANLAAFRETAGRLDPSLEPREVYRRHVAAVHPSAQELLPVTAEMLEGLRSFLIERDIVTIPSEVRCRVAETPRYKRWAFAMMDTPGPYETQATEAYYYVTPVDPGWDERQAEEWLRALNTFALEDISIHEAYPGHYVHFLHFQSAPSEVSKRLWSYAFTEGWAHYAEQMMWEEGYRDGDLRFRLAQLSEALVRNCRLVCALELHAGEMSVEEATAYFVEHAFYDETPARHEAERGTFDPGYLSYTLGKLQILRLREDFLGAGRTLKDFHDRLLSRGAPPVELMRGVMLP